MPKGLKLSLGLGCHSRHSSAQSVVSVPNLFQELRSDKGNPAFFTVVAAQAGNTTDIYVGAVFGGVTLANNDVVLVYAADGQFAGLWQIDQTVPGQNRRPMNADSDAELLASPYVYCTNGTQASKWFRLDTHFYDTFATQVWFALPGQSPQGGPTYLSSLPVPQLTDQTGLGHHMTQATDAKQALYVPNVLAGQPGWLFDGVDDFYDSATFTALTVSTIIMAIKMVSVADRQVLCCAADDTGTSGHWLQAGGPTLPGKFFMASINTSPGTHFITNLSTVLAAKFARTAASRLQVNGINDAAADTGTASCGSFRIGAQRAGTNHANFYLFAREVYSRVLTDAEVTARVSALSARYGGVTGHFSVPIEQRVTEDSVVRSTEDGDPRILEV